MLINFDFGDLQAFLAVKETGSFHAAAERLNLSQPAVTRRVRKLEEALGSTLFERTTRAVKPTLAAKRLQARAEAILEDAQDTARAMRDDSVAFAHQRSLIVTVATIPTVVSRVITPAVAAFRAAGHVARIRILDADANEVTEAVSGGDADFGLCSIPALERTTMFEPLFDDRIVLVAPPSHDLAGKAGILASDLSDVSLILPARGTGNRLLIDEAMARARVHPVWTYEVGRTATALDMVADGQGVALVPLSSIGRAQVVVCTLDLPDIQRPIGLLTRTGQADTTAAAALKQAIRSIVA
ncbi:LysR family transcriptional regulator [Falsiruegeria mediterranea]|uniref:HTH-type transcriptional regulator CynR n=1 Tax=Falsiruegeria mediterranea M17 TaxID=1200281 RepID=A0A2R8CEH2_9RHOB|nr:LysR family transcriptional regulator [Falsiruegeria mediterranea]SPJ30688.1 HTH-type transcriptional regulator CynR [Falsiruegeria mediterranea M17]